MQSTEPFTEPFTAGPSGQQRALCVSIHDVAPATWQQCALLLDAVHAVADIPVTLLVVPVYHHQDQAPPQYLRMLERRLDRGDELALHGYVHLDEGPPARSWRERYARRVYTTSEGEFAALSEQQAADKLAAGLDWFARRGWPVQGFVPPAWLISAGTWRALRRFPFLYATTWRSFHWLAAQAQTPAALAAPSLVYSSRNAWGREASRCIAGWSAQMLGDAPLARLSLHPRDALYPRTVSHFQELLRRLLKRREAMTKARFANAWRGHCALST
jgi:predicted deacetylase